MNLLAVTVVLAKIVLVRALGVLDGSIARLTIMVIQVVFINFNGE